MSRLEQWWQKRSWQSALLLPVSWLYGTLLAIRHLAYRQGWAKRGRVSLPVVVVGNLTVGGTGKTPLCATLVERFRRAGWRPAIVSRGYGGERHEQPYLVSDADTASKVGDEPLMLFHQSGVPVCVCIDRCAAVEHIATNTDANLVIADDGLQHLAMPRIAQVLVVDGSRGFGNRWLLPAGPLRDTLGSVKAVDMVAFQVPSAGPAEQTLAGLARLHVSIGISKRPPQLSSSSDNRFALAPTVAVELVSGKQLAIEQLAGQSVHAVAGIGHPLRFFDSLRRQGMVVEEHAFADHHEFAPGDVSFADSLPVLMTSKDAVKLRHWEVIPRNVYEVCTRVQMSDALSQAIDQLEIKVRERVFHQHPEESA